MSLLHRSPWVDGALVTAAVTAIALAIGLLPAGSSEYDGIYGRAQEGCTCHSTQPSPEVTAILEGVPANYEPGSSYTLRINETGGPPPATGLAQGGFGLKVSAGSLQAPDARVLASGQEATQTVEGNRARGWTVLWTAPTAGAGRVTFWLSTNAVNGDNTSKKDQWGQVILFSDPPGVEPPPNHPPEILGFEGPLEALVGYPNLYLANASDPDGDSLKFTWVFADGSPEQIGRRVNHVFLSPGTFDAYLTASDTRGANATYPFTVAVSVPAEPLPPTNLEFTHTFVDGVVTLGSTVEILCRVHNAGDFAVTNVMVHLHNLSGADLARKHPILPVLLPNQSKEVRMTWSPPRTGSYELVVTGRGAEALGADSDAVLIEVVQAGVSSLDTQLGLASLPLAAAVAFFALRRYRA